MRGAVEDDGDMSLEVRGAVEAGPSMFGKTWFSLIIILVIAFDSV